MSANCSDKLRYRVAKTQRSRTELIRLRQRPSSATKIGIPCRCRQANRRVRRRKQDNIFLNVAIPSLIRITFQAIRHSMDPSTPFDPKKGSNNGVCFQDGGLTRESRQSSAAIDIDFCPFRASHRSHIHMYVCMEATLSCA
ncbi:hypothetical protein HD806DRAFT_990 [Xylariaceae sp. AK1471]|nr:hypothetical protein HD806DRAFT_990 [Xylariaceae sp. AK1471]